MTLHTLWLFMNYFQLQVIDYHSGQGHCHVTKHQWSWKKDGYVHLEKPGVNEAKVSWGCAGTAGVNVVGVAQSINHNDLLDMECLLGMAGLFHPLKTI